MQPHLGTRSNRLPGRYPSIVLLPDAGMCCPKRSKRRYRTGAVALCGLVLGWPSTSSIPRAVRFTQNRSRRSHARMITFQCLLGLLGINDGSLIPCKRLFGLIRRAHQPSNGRACVRVVKNPWPGAYYVQEAMNVSGIKLLRAFRLAREPSSRGMLRLYCALHCEKSSVSILKSCTNIRSELPED